MYYRKCSMDLELLFHPILQEIDPDVIKNQVKDDSNIIEIREATFAWGESKQLHDINLDIKEGDITAIVGQVGSGKSSLLQVSIIEKQIIIDAFPKFVQTSQAEMNEMPCLLGKATEQYMKTQVQLTM